MVFLNLKKFEAKTEGHPEPQVLEPELELSLGFGKKENQKIEPEAIL